MTPEGAEPTKPQRKCPHVGLSRKAGGLYQCYECRQTFAVEPVEAAAPSPSPQTEAYELAEEFLNAYDDDEEHWDEALSALGAKYGVKKGGSILATMFEFYRSRTASPSQQTDRAASSSVPATIDVKNLRFYASMAREFDWHTDIIHKSVITQTLNEIADRLAVASSVPAQPTWGWIVKQIHSHKPILACPQCGAQSDRQAENRCSGNEDNCPMDSSDGWLARIVKLNIDAIAGGFYGDPRFEEPSVPAPPAKLPKEVGASGRCWKAEGEWNNATTMWPPVNTRVIGCNLNHRVRGIMTCQRGANDERTWFWADPRIRELKIVPTHWTPLLMFPDELAKVRSLAEPSVPPTESTPGNLELAAKKFLNDRGVFAMRANVLCNHRPDEPEVHVFLDETLADFVRSLRVVSEQKRSVPPTEPVKPESELNGGKE